MRIYVACLASYNNGVLHGAWIDAQSDADAMQEEVNAMLRASKFPNVTVECPECDGTGLLWNGNPETQYECPNCREGRVQSAEEYAIHDFDGLPSTMGEYCGLQAVADYVEFVEECADHYGDGEELAKAMLENWHSVEDAKEALENFAGVFDRFRDYADEAADEMIQAHTHGKEVPQALINYFDYDAWARDLAIEMTALDMPSGVAVFHP